MTAFLIVLTAVAITVVWTEGSIFKPIREHGPFLWKDLAGCPLCSGCWIGWLWAGFWMRRELVAAPLEWGPYAFGLGCLVGVSAMTVKLAWDVLDALDRSLPLK